MKREKRYITKLVQEKNKPIPLLIGGENIISAKTNRELRDKTNKNGFGRVDKKDLNIRMK